MSKVKAEIVSGVRFGGTLYVSGMEDQLAKAATADQIKHLTDQGAIAGEWVAGKKEEPAKETAKEDPKK